MGMGELGRDLLSSQHDASQPTHTGREPQGPLEPRTRATRKTETRVNDRENCNADVIHEADGWSGRRQRRSERDGNAVVRKSSKKTTYVSYINDRAAYRAPTSINQRTAG